MEDYENRQYMNYLNMNYQQALRKSGKGFAAKSLLPVGFLALCISALIACPFILYSIVTHCYYPDKEENKDDSEKGFSDFETTTILQEPTKCSVGYGAGLIVSVVLMAFVSLGLAILCHRIYKRYAAEEYIVHAGSAKIRVDGTEKAPPGQAFVIGIAESYHMYFLSVDAMVRKLEQPQEECIKNMVINCWFEEEANDENRAEINDVQLSEYLYSIENPLLWQKYQDLSVSKGQRGDQGGYINLDCLGSDCFELKSLLTSNYIRDVEMAFPSNWNEASPRFTGKEGLFFMATEVNEIIPIINKGIKLKKGPLGKAVYMYENIKTAVEKLTVQLHCEPKCLLVVRAHIENVCTLSKRPTYSKPHYQKYSMAVVESEDQGVAGREFAFFDPAMCVPLFVVIYRRKFRKEAQAMREAVFKIMNEQDVHV